MKKLIICIVLIAIFVATSCVAVGCQHNTNITMYVPDGAPALAVATLLDNNNIKSGQVDTTIANATTVQAKLMAEEVDMAIVPITMAYNIHKKTSNYKLVSANVFGLMYIVGLDNTDKLEQLQGKVIHSIGKNNTAQYVMETIFASKGYQFVESDKPVQGKIAIKYYTAGSDIVSQISGGDIEYACLGEPAVSKYIQVATANDQNAKVLFDLQQLWQDATNGSVVGYPQAGLVVKSSLLDSDVVNQVLERLQDNSQFVGDNIDRLQQLLVDSGSVDWNVTAITEQIVSNCNIGYGRATDIEDEIVTYLTKFFADANGDFIA